MDNIINIAIHDCGDITARVMDAVVGDAVLREVVGANFFAAVAGANEGFAGIRGSGHLFGFFLFEETGAEDGHGFDAVLLLGALILHGNHNTGGEVSDANGGIGGIDALAAVATGAVNINAKVFGIDF